MTCPIFMKDAKDIKRVNEVATQTTIDMYVQFGTRTIDPRSLLGLFTFMGKDALLVAPDDTDPKHFLYIIKKMSVAK